MLEIGQILALVVSIIAALLNILTGGLALFAQKLKTKDLVLIFLICLLDTLFYFNNIVRMVLIMYYESETLLPAFWCPYDTTISFATLQTSMELVAVLSVMRYWGICYKKRMSDYIWLGALFLSLLTSIGISAGNYHYNIYKWSISKLFCLPVINPYPNRGPNNRIYFTTFVAFYMARFLLTLGVIVYCYFKVAVAYNKQINEATLALIKAQSPTSNVGSNVNNSHHQPNVSTDSNYTSLPLLTSSNQDSNELETNRVERVIHIENQSHHYKVATTLRLMGAAIAYSIALIPDMVASVSYIQGHHYESKEVYTVTHLLMCTGGLVNAIFVLTSHDPTKNCLLGIWKRIFEKSIEDPSGSSFQ